VRWDLIGVFIVSTANAYRERLAPGLRAPESGLEHAIDAGLVRLSVQDGAPVWLLTEAAVDAVKLCLEAATAEGPALPPAPAATINAEQAAAEFLARGKS
jgi:hypothetical protein